MGIFVSVLVAELEVEGLFAEGFAELFEVALETK